MASYRTAGGLLKDYYDLLGVRRRAARAEIDRAYKQLSARYAPRLDPRTVQDPNLRDDVALSFQLRTEKTRELNEAYEVLGDARRRAEYDRLLDAADRTAAAPVRYVADPSRLCFGEVDPQDTLTRDFWLVTEPPGQPIPADLRTSAPPWLHVEPETSGFSGYATMGSVRFRVRLLPRRLPAGSVVPGQISITCGGQRIDVGALVLLHDHHGVWRAAAPGGQNEGNEPQQPMGKREGGRGPSFFRLFLLELLGLCAALGVFLLFQTASKLVILGLALLLGALCLAVETRAFGTIDRRPWYVKGLAGIVLAICLPLAILVATAF